jgi:DnaJ-class molecular chaperone
MSSEGQQRGVDIRATLVISETEALIGTSRTLTLSGGRLVSVFVPEGTQDGQVIRLEGQGDLSGSGGQPGALILTIAIRQEEELGSTYPAFSQPLASHSQEVPPPIPYALSEYIPQPGTLQGGGFEHLHPGIPRHHRRQQ